jgi:hypothetical protein
VDAQTRIQEEGGRVKCLLCLDRESGERYACWGCINDHLRILRELELYVSVLVTMTTPRKGGGGRGAPGFSSTSPANDDVLSALDPRSRPGHVDQDGDAMYSCPEDTRTWVRSIPGSLTSIATWIAEEKEQGLIYPRTITRDLGYIRQALAWCAEQQWIDELASDIRELHGQARSLAGDKPQPPLGQCLNITCEGNVYWVKTGARCSTCRRPYDGLDLIRLGAARQEAG